MARAPAKMPAATRGAFNRLAIISGLSIGALGLSTVILGLKPTTDQSQQGVSNTTIILVSFAGIAVAWLLSRTGK